jgi:WD40 repeat protein
MPHFDFPKVLVGANVVPDERGRFYKVGFQNHDGNIVGMFTIQNEKRADILSVDSAGGLKILNVAALSSEVLELFENDPVVVTAVTLNRTTNVIYMGMKSGAIWGSNLESSEEINYTHAGQVTAIAAFKSVIISAGVDKVIKIFHVPKGEVIATMRCSNEISHLNMLTVVRGGPVAIADVLGNVSVWSPHRLAQAGVEDSVQSVCNMNGRPVALDTIQLFDRTCLICVTGAWIRIWAVSIVEDGIEVISILRDPVYSLVRSIEAPEFTEFTSCCNTSTDAVATLLTGCSDGSVYQWHALSGARLRKYEISPNANTFLVHISSKHLFAACDNSNDLNIIDPNSTALIDRTDVIEDITCGALCDFRGVITVVGAGGNIHIRNGDTQISSRSARRIDTGAISALSIMALESSENIVIVVGFITGMMQSYVGSVEDDFVFDHFAMKELRVYKSRVTVIRNFGKEDLVATGSELESIIIWKASDKGLARVTELANTVYATCITSSPLGFIAIGTEEGTLSLYNCKTWKPIASKAKAHNDEGIRSIGILYDPVKNCRYLVSVGKRCRSTKAWKQHASSLVFENRIDLPSNCSDVRFWEKGESSLMFIQTTSKFSYCVDMKDPQRGPLRFFTANGGELLAVSGNSSPVVLTVGSPENGSRGNVVNIWNNDLHDEQVAHNNLWFEFDVLAADPTSPKSALYAAVKAHPSYPGCLLDTDPHRGDETFFSRAIMGKQPDFVTEFLPKVPAAVLQKFQFRGKYRTLLWIAMKMKDSVSADCILRIWTDILTSPPNSIEESVWHAGDLFEDLKILSRENPAKFADFIRHLKIPINHSITCQGCDSKDIVGDEIWMRGSALRVIPHFWAQVTTAFPDLQGRIFEPEKEAAIACVEAPHEDPGLREPFTRTFEPARIKAHPSVNAGRQGKLVIEDSEWDMNGVSGKLGGHSSLALEKHILSSGGSVVQSYIHPIPYAAAGVEFLQICQNCCSSSGRQTLMASPVVSTVIDYKWRTFFGDLHVGVAMHYMYVLILYSICVVYFDAMIDAPTKTGLPVLAWIGFIFVAVSYSFLLVQELLRFAYEGLAACDEWLGVGLVAYCLAIAGITMTLVEGETTFNARCVLAIACLFLYLKFLNFLL